MHSPRTRLTGALAALCAAVVCLCATAAAASADVTSVYPPETQSRDFAGGEGGWESSTEQKGLLGGALCVPPVTCPSITDEYEAAGGVGGSGDGFIETSEGGLTSLGALGAAVSTGIYESPAFTYNGAAGQAPTKVELGIARRASLAGLLAVSGATATYGVELVDASSTSGTVIVIDSSSLEGAPEEWKTLSASVSPSALTPGHSYRVRIKTTFDTPALVLPSGGVGYDNVAVTATKVEGANGGNGGNGNNGNGSSGHNGAGGNAGAASGRLSDSRLLSLFRGTAATPVALKGNRLFVKVSCPAKIGRACHIAAQGMLSRRKAATSKRVVKVGKGKGKRIVLRVKPKAKKKVAKRKRLLVREKVRAGKAHATLYQHRKLIRRR